MNKPVLTEGGVFVEEMKIPLSASTAKSLLDLVTQIYGATHPSAPYGRAAVARIHRLIGNWKMPTGPGILVPGQNNTATAGDLVVPKTAVPVAARGPKLNSKGRVKGEKRGPKPLRRGIQPSGLIVP